MMKTIRVTVCRNLLSFKVQRQGSTLIYCTYSNLTHPLRFTDVSGVFTFSLTSEQSGLDHVI